MNIDLIKLLSEEIPDLTLKLDKNICVYAHVNLENSEVFYIGIGVNSRPYNRTGRNKNWLDYVTSILFNYRVDILFDNLDYGQASEHEKRLIALYGRKDKGFGTLLNLTDGGGWSEKYARLNRAHKIQRAKEQLSKILLLEELETEIKTTALACLDKKDFQNKHPHLFLLSQKIKIIDKFTYKNTPSIKECKEKLSKIENFINEFYEIYNIQDSDVIEDVVEQDFTQEIDTV